MQILKFALVMGTLFGAVAQAGVAFQKFDWDPNSGAFRLAVEGGRLTGHLPYGGVVTVSTGGIHAVLQSYKPSMYVTAVVSKEDDTEASIFLLFPPDYEMMSCAPILDNKEIAASDLEGIINSSNLNNGWDIPQALWSMAYFFSKKSGPDHVLSVYADQLQNGSIKKFAPSFKCGARNQAPAVAVAPPAAVPPDTALPPDRPAVASGVLPPAPVVPLPAPTAVGPSEGPSVAPDRRVDAFGDSALAAWYERKRKYFEAKRNGTPPPQPDAVPLTPFQQQEAEYYRQHRHVDNGLPATRYRAGPPEYDPRGDWIQQPYRRRFAPPPAGY